MAPILNMMMFRRSIRVLVLIAFAVCVARSQDEPITEWVSLTADKGDVTVEVPRRMLMHDEPNDQTVYFHAKNFSGSVSREKRDGKMAVSYIRPRQDDKTVYQSLEFQGYYIVRSLNIKDKWHSERIYIASGTRYYQISASGKDRKDDRVRRVLDSIHIKGKPLFKNTAPLAGVPSAEVFDISQIKTSPEIQDALKKPEPSSKLFRYEKLPPGPEPEPDTIDFTRVLIILRKEKAQYTSSARDRNIQGSVTGRVLFKADGTIGEIIMDTTLDRGLARNCARAASRMKFLPAEIDGKPVDQWRPITFTFNIY